MNHITRPFKAVNCRLTVTLWLKQRRKYNEALPKPPIDNFPYRADTFSLIRRLSFTVNRYNRQYNVPPIAVAGAIADEYNTRIFPKSVIDWFQDEILINWMPSSFIALDAKIGLNSKWLNSTKHDIGIGNIKLETAKRIYERHNNRFGKQIDNWDELVDYILTDKGTIHIASLVIKRAQFLFKPYIKNYPIELKEAVFVTYYKQGPIYLARFRSKPSRERNKGITPGEGCRTYYQRDEFKKALGII